MKKHWKLIVAICAAVCVIAAAVAMISSGGHRDQNVPEETSDATVSTGVSGEPAAFTVCVQSELGKVFEGVSVYIYEDATLSDLVWFARTDDQGTITFDAIYQDGYVAVLQDVPQGYLLEESFPLTGLNTTLVLPVQMPGADALADLSLGLGDVMCDLIVTDVSGNTYQISQLLEEKDAVVLNLWYLGCTPCKMEFPYLQEAYEAYSDQIAVLALNPVDSDNTAIAAYAKELGLTFPVASFSQELQQAMNIGAYPTTVVIDRYGIISMIHEGALSSAQDFMDIFAHFTGENYDPNAEAELDEILSGETDEEDYENPTAVGGVTSFQLTVKPGEVVYCDVYRVSGMYMQIKSANAYLIYNGNTYNPSNGAIGMVVYTKDVRTPATIGLGNRGTETETFTITFSALAGTLNNPYSMSLGEFDVSVPAGKEEGVYFLYVAQSDGYLAVQCLSATAGVPYDYTLYNLNSYANRNLGSDAGKDTSGNTVVRILVKKGQRIQFSCSSLPDNSGNYPAIQFRFKAYMEENTDQEEVEVQKTVYSLTVTDAKRNPISGVQVNIENADGTVKEKAQTNEQGAAVFKLVPGTYKAIATVPLGYTARNTEATLTESAPSQSLKFDAVVVEYATYTVKVVDEQGNPMSGVLVSLGGISATTDASGIATFELNKGSYTAVVQFPQGYTADSMAYPVPADSTSLTVTLRQDSGSQEPEENSQLYSVKVTNYYGNPMLGVTVTFFSGGTPVGLQSVDASGTASMELPKGSYTVELAFDSGSNYYCDTSNVVLTQENPSVTVMAAEKRGDSYIMIYDTWVSYYLKEGGTYVDGMQSNVINYFIFQPTRSGVYRFTTNDPNAEISYWGATTSYISNQTAVTDYANNTFTREIKDDQLENTVLILGITGAEHCIVEITRIGDIELSVEEQAQWIIYEGSQTPASGTVYRPSESGRLTYVDVSAANGTYNLVKGSDGFYHLGSPSGPLMYMNLGPNGRYVSFYSMMGFEQAGGTGMKQYLYDENGQFLRKEDYSVCFKAYIAAVDVSGDGVYPLTDDLIYILQNGGDHKGWWDPDNGNYLFSSVTNLNTQIAWMFNCCYYS